MNSTHLERFLDDLKFRRRFSHYTVRCYDADLRQFRDFLAEGNGHGDAALTHVDAMGVCRFVDHLNKSGHRAATIGRKLSALNCFYRWLI